MDLVVQKFGGSSVATPEMIERVAAGIVETRRRGHDVVVVVSAMGKTTDELLELATRISDLPSPRELDLLLASGEQVSSSLLAMAVQVRGERAVALTGAQSGILTTASHGGAKVADVHPQRIREELARGRIAIVAGFQGVSPDEELTTLGRGGSDTSAVALAHALGADVCEICTDVDGVYSADPRVVQNARRLEAVDYEEMYALALNGARVLHVEAVELARRHGVPVRVRSTFGSGGGTRVGPVETTPLDAVAGRKDLLGVAGAGHGVRTRVLERAREASIPEHDLVVREKEGAPEGFELLMRSENVADTSGFAADLTQDFPQLTVTPGLGSVSAVGRHLTRRQELLETFRSFPAPILGHFKCPVSMSCVVHASHVDDTARALHERLVEPGFQVAGPVEAAA